MMPTVMVSGPYRFFFYSGDRQEPLHVHVQRDNMVAKFWVDPVRLRNSGGFSRLELRRIERLIKNAERGLVEEWHEFFSK